MLASDQTLILYDIIRNLVRKFKLTQNSSESTDFFFFNGIEWLVDDLLFSVYNVNGLVKLYDVGFSEIDLFYATRYLQKFTSLSEYLNANLFVPMMTHASMASSQLCNCFAKLVSSRNIFTDSLIACFVYARGPFGLLRLSLPDNFNHVCLVNHYLKHSQTVPAIDHEAALKISSSSKATNTTNKSGAEEEREKEEANNPIVNKHLTSSVNLLHTLDWNSESHVCLSLLSRILNFILSERVVFDARAEMLVEEALASFYKPRRALLETTIYEYKRHVSRHARRFFYQLAKHARLSKAFRLAVDIGAKDLFNDLYYCALDNSERQLAEACRQKYHDILDAERQSQMRSDLSKSVTSIDDNIRGAHTEFDRDSVSSSENENSLNEGAGLEYDVDSAESDYDLECEYLSDAQKTLVDGEKKFKLAKKNLRLLLQESAKNKATLKVYTEEEIENFAKNILNENAFIYNLRLDS